MFPARALWTLSLNSVLTAPPGFGGTQAYFPIEGNRLVAYDLLLGRRLWTTPAQPMFEPVVGDGLVFIVEPGALVALRDDSGAIAWRLPITESPVARLVWRDGWLIAAGADGTIFAFRAVDGELIWSRETGAPASAPPSVAADRVYVPTHDGRLLALGAETGEPIWERRLGDTLHEVLALDDRLYVGSNDNFLYCVKTRDGQINWRWRTGADVVGRPVVDQDRVYFVSLDNVLRALDRTSGAQQWRSALPLRPRGGPRRAGDTLIVGGIGPRVIGYRSSDGAVVGEQTFTGELAAPPYVVPTATLPTFVVVTRDVAKGATVIVFSRAIEPAISPVAPLRNAMPPMPPATQ